MATRAEILKKYGIVRLMRPSFANEELTDEEAMEFEEATKKLAENFDSIWEEDDSGDID